MNRKIRRLDDPKTKNPIWDNVKIFIVGVLFTVAMLILIFLASALSSCTSHAQSMPRQELREDTTELRAIIRAYNHVLHRIWIDKPNYVEDVLTESDEFVELNSLLYSQWEDTFDFYNEQDSIDYHWNWIHEGECIHTIPKNTLDKLKEVFPDYGER